MIWAAVTTVLGIVLTAPPAPAQEKGNGWAIEQLGIGTKPELAVDGKDRIHIAFMTEDFSGGVFHALRGTEGWEITTLVVGYFYGPLDLAIDSHDWPHVAYHDHSTGDGDMVYAYFDGTDWNRTIIEDDGYDGWDSSIAVGPNDEVYLAGIDPLQFGVLDGVEWASMVGDRWVVESVGFGAVPYEFGTDIVIDGLGILHMAFHAGGEVIDTNGADLVYAVWRGGAWSTSIVDEAGDVGNLPLLDWTVSIDPTSPTSNGPGTAAPKTSDLSNTLTLTVKSGLSSRWPPSKT